MSFSMKHLLLIACAYFSTAQHTEDPLENDVQSPSFCQTNRDGFGGRPLSTETPEENVYFYELTFGGTNVEGAISELEVRIANYLLAESSLFDICLRRLKTVQSPQLRKLQQGGAVAITTRPDDFLYNDVVCSSSGTLSEGQTCVVVEGAYTVYFEEGSVDNSAVMGRMNGAVKEGMDSDKFLGGDVSKVVWIESPESSSAANRGTDTIRSGSDDGIRSMPIIIGASVGGLAAIALIAFYRQRSLKAQDEDTFATPGGSANYMY